MAAQMHVHPHIRKVFLSFFIYYTWDRTTDHINQPPLYWTCHMFCLFGTSDSLPVCIQTANTKSARKYYWFHISGLADRESNLQPSRHKLGKLLHSQELIKIYSIIYNLKMIYWYPSGMLRKTKLNPCPSIRNIARFHVFMLLKDHNGWICHSYKARRTCAHHSCKNNWC